MKTSMTRTLSIVVPVILSSCCLQAQITQPVKPVESSTAPTVVETGPHHRTWQTVKVGLDQRGQQVATTNSYVEVATGMNVFSEAEGRWVPASDEIELVNGGAIAVRTQAKAIFLPNLNDPAPP